MTDSATSDTAADELLAIRCQLGEREVIVLFYLEQLKLSEIAAVLSAPVGTIKSRLHRAREQMRQTLEPDPGTSRDPVQPDPVQTQSKGNSA